MMLPHRRDWHAYIVLFAQELNKTMHAVVVVVVVGDMRTSNPDDKEFQVKSDCMSIKLYRESTYDLVLLA